MRARRLLIFVVSFLAFGSFVFAVASNSLILATTTSTQDSGLLDVLLPMFERKTGISVKPIAVGTGQALKMGERGDADVLLVHAPELEEKFMREGHGSLRKRVMHNDFVLVGPKDAPASVRKAKTAADALRGIAYARLRFVSRGDESGTHQLEKKLWRQARIEAKSDWYLETGQGMAATLRVADTKRGFTLTDRGTFLAQRSTLALAIVREGDRELFNLYHVIVVNPKKHPGINAAGAKAFADFLLAPETQKVIGKFGEGRFGQSLFTPDAKRRGK